MKANGMFLVTALLLFAAAANAAPQIQSYTLTPDRLKAGMSGSINIIFYNPSATEYLSGAQLDASSSQLIFSGGTSLGDIGTLGTTVSSVGFKVREEATPGIYTVTLTLAYSTNAGASSGYKIFSIPVTIYPNLVIQVKDFQVSRAVISPGDTFEVTGKLVSRGGELRHVTLEFPAASNFTLEDTSKIDIGTLTNNREYPISFRVIARETAPSGYYSIPMTLTYDDAVSTSNSDQLSFGPITVSGEISRISIAAIDAVFNPGSEPTLRLELRNNGDTTLENIRITLPDSSDFFVPLDFSEKTIDSVLPKSSKIAEFRIGVKTNIAPQVYQIPLGIRYESKTLGSKEYTKNVGVKVAGTPKLTVIASTSPAPMKTGAGEYTLSVQVSNVGNAAVRAVSIHVDSGIVEFIGSHVDYLGTLNLDDYSTSQYSVVVKPGTKPGTYPLVVMVNYKDAFNTEYSQSISTDIEVASAELVALSSTPQPTNPLYVVIGLVVVGAVLYWGYRRFFRKKKHVQ
ncbi:MAG: hypothetical protein V1787_05245 [Candidatus Micrarchaeota archaeon]